jgi:hypothetical protein
MSIIAPKENMTDRRAAFWGGGRGGGRQWMVLRCRRMVGAFRGAGVSDAYGLGRDARHRAMEHGIEGGCVD